MKKTLLLLLFLIAAATVPAQHWRDTAAYRLNKLQPHDRIIPEGDWQRSLSGLWASINCLGFSGVLIGQKRLPTPPAIITR